jgi:gluconokinase
MLSAEPISQFYSPKVPIPVKFHLTMNGQVTEAKEVEHIWLVTGPAGCGKTTVAKYLAKELSLPYVEGDDVGSIHTFLMPTAL